MGVTEKQVWAEREAEWDITVTESSLCYGKLVSQDSPSKLSWIKARRSDLSCQPVMDEERHSLSGDNSLQLKVIPGGLRCEISHPILLAAHNYKGGIMP